MFSRSGFTVGGFELIFETENALLSIQPGFFKKYSFYITLVKKRVVFLLMQKQVHCISLSLLSICLWLENAAV